MGRGDEIPAVKTLLSHGKKPVRSGKNKTTIQIIY